MCFNLYTYQITICYQELKTQVPSPENQDGNCDACRQAKPDAYLAEDVIGMVSFQKDLVENIAVSPVWFNGAFVKKEENPTSPKQSKKKS